MKQPQPARPNTDTGDFHSCNIGNVHLSGPDPLSGLWHKMVTKVFTFFLSTITLCWLTGCAWQYDTYTIVDANGASLSGVYVVPQALRPNPMSRSNVEGQLKDSIKKEPGEKILLVKDGYGHAFVIRNDRDIYYLPQNMHLFPVSQTPYEYYLALEEDWAKRTGNAIHPPRLKDEIDFEQGSILDAWSGDYWIPYGHLDFSTSVNRELEDRENAKTNQRHLTPIRPPNMTGE